MTIFTKNATAPAGAEGGYPLPDGYDDPTGPTYVADRYRDAWARHAGNADIPGNLTPFCRPIAEYRALKEARPDEFEPQRGPIESRVDPDTGIRLGRALESVAADEPAHQGRHRGATAERGEGPLVSLHWPRPPRPPGHPDSGRCATLLDDDSRCLEAPAFEVECVDCGVYFEVCVPHRMDLAGEWGITCPECDSVSFYITMMS